MSHITRIRTKMVEETYLLAALKDLGYGIDKGNVDTRGGAIKVRTGILRPSITFRKDGESYSMNFDNMLDPTGKKTQRLLQQITQRYAYNAAVSKLLEQGFSLVNEEVQESERIHLVMRRTA